MLDKKVRTIPNCDGCELIERLVYYENRIYWLNAANACENGERCGVVFYYRIGESKEAKIVSDLDWVSSPAAYGEGLVYLKGGDGKDSYIYYRNVVTNESRRIENGTYLFGYRSGLWKNLIINWSGNIIKSLNIDAIVEKNQM